MSRVIVLNSKGGTTKSTTVVQIIIPYLHLNNGENIVSLVEFDDENEDSLTFQNSEILNAKRIKVSSTDIESELTNTVLNNEILAIDVGGNRTTTDIIKALENNGMISLIDLVVIPLTDGEQDAINALKIYKDIKVLSPEMKTIFVLGRAGKTMDTELQFLDFFGDTKGRIDDRVGLIEQIYDTDRNIAKMTNSDVIKFSRAFGITAWELAHKDTDALQEKIKTYARDGEIDKAKKASYRLSIIKKAKNYKDEILMPSFKVISKVLGKA